MNAARLTLSPSPLLAALIVSIHATAGFSAWVSLPSPLGVLLGAAFLALGLSAAWGRAFHRAASSVRGLEIDTGPELRLELANGARFDCEVGQRRYVSSLIVALPVRITGSRVSRRTIFVTRDMLAPDSFRTLRIWALWGRLPAQPAPPGVAAAQLLP